MRNNWSQHKHCESNVQPFLQSYMSWHPLFPDNKASAQLQQGHDYSLQIPINPHRHMSIYNGGRMVIQIKYYYSFPRPPAHKIIVWGSDSFTAFTFGLKLIELELKVNQIKPVLFSDICLYLLNPFTTNSLSFSQCSSSWADRTKSWQDGCVTGKTNHTLQNWEAQRQYCFLCYTLFESTLIRSHCLVSVIYTSRKALEAAGQRATALHFSVGTFWRGVDTADSGGAASAVRLCVNMCQFILALLPWVYQTWQKPCTHRGVCTFFNRRGFCRAICVCRGIIKLAGDLQTRGMQYCKWYQYQVNTRPVSLILIPIRILYTDKSSLCTFLVGLDAIHSLWDDRWLPQSSAERVPLTAALGNGNGREEEKEEEQSVQPRCERSSVCKDMTSLWWNRCKLAPSECQE